LEGMRSERVVIWHLLFPSREMAKGKKHLS
jgi:hypothetical protein